MKMFTAKSLAKMLVIFAQRMAGKEFSPYEVEAKTKDGRKITIEIHGSLLKIKEKTVGDVVVLRDISSRKEIQEELKESEEKLKTMFEEAPAAYFLCDLKGTFIDGNKKAEELVGHKREELIGKSMLKLNLVPLDQITRVAGRLAEHAKGKSTTKGEFTLVRKDGKKVTADISGTVLKFKKKTIVLGIAIDVTNRIQASKELEKKNKELEKFTKLATGREIKMIELKKEIKQLKEELGSIKNI